METLRQLMRKLLGSRSWPYRLASRMLAAVTILHREGLETLLVLWRLQRAMPGAAPVPVNFRRLQCPLLLRPGSRDIDSILSNIIYEDCGRFSLQRPPLNMIDAGAYIGDTTVYFLNRFPDLRMIALEPNPESYDLAKRNLVPYNERTTLLPLALSASARTVYISGHESGAKIDLEKGIEAKATTIQELLKRLPDGRADILKMDVEGEESAIFSANPENWLSKIGLLIIETHGENAASTVLEVLNRNGWQTVRHRTQFFSTPPIQIAPKEWQYRPGQ